MLFQTPRPTVAFSKGVNTLRFYSVDTSGCRIYSGNLFKIESDGRLYIFGSTSTEAREAIGATAFDSNGALLVRSDYHVSGEIAYDPRNAGNTLTGRTIKGLPGFTPDELYEAAYFLNFENGGDTLKITVVDSYGNLMVTVAVIDSTGIKLRAGCTGYADKVGLALDANGQWAVAS